MRICGKCRAAFRRVACCASALSSHRSTITRLPSGTSPSQLHSIFAPSALFPGISRRCTWRCIRLRLRSSRYRRIRFNRECHPSWHLRRLASRRYASHRNPTASAQAVCHPLSGGSVACLVSACASLHAGDRALCAVIAFQCSAVQQIAVQCLQFALHCALKSRFLCARQGLKAKHCFQSVQAMGLRRFSQRTGSTTSAGGRGASAAGPETLREAGLCRRRRCARIW